MIRKHSTLIASLALATLFVLIGVAFVPKTGAQYDEALFVMSIFSPESVEFHVLIGSTKVPLMLMTYLGTLKAALLAPVFDLIGYNHRSLRLPPLGFGALSVVLYFLALRRLIPSRIAVLSALLLATDAAYLLTCVFDWGPVALQHLFFSAIFYSLVRYSEDRSPRWLALCGIASGLALWDKAVSVWIFAGAGLALILVFPSDLLGVVKRPKLAAALILTTLLGGAPLVYYNIEKPWATLHPGISNADSPIITKIANVDAAMDGRGLFGYIVRNSPDPEGRNGKFQLHERASLWLSKVLDYPRHSLQHLVLVLSLLAVPLMFWSPWRRMALFTALALVISWALMALTRGAGGSLHHTILLWPMPHLLAALVIAEAVRRLPANGLRIAAAVFLVATLTNLFVLNQYYAQFLAYGPTSTWTNAARPLVDTLGRMESRIVFPADWGIQQQIDFYGAGRLGMVRNAEDSMIRQAEPQTRRFLEAMFADERNIFVTHTPANEAFKGTRAKMIDFGMSLGYSDRILSVIRDSHSVPIYEIHEFRK